MSSTNKPTRLEVVKDSARSYSVPDLGVSITKERIGTGAGGGEQRDEWSVATEDNALYGQRLNECRGFLDEVYQAALVKVSLGRTRKQAKLKKAEARTWKTADGIEVRRLRAPHESFVRPRQQIVLDPDDARAVNPVVEGPVQEVERFLRKIPWRGYVQDGDES